jgi:hypothetical protein
MQEQTQGDIYSGCKRTKEKRQEGEETPDGSMTRAQDGVASINGQHCV